jgi:hypothetical protein
MNDETTSPLPDLQPLADSLEDLAQGDWVQHLAKVNEQLAGVVSGEHALSVLKERALELAQGLEDLKTEREVAAHGLQALGHDLAAAAANWQAGLKDAGTALQDSCGTLKSKLADFARQGKDHVDQLRSTVADQLHAAHLGAIKDSGAALADCARDTRSKAEALGGDLVSKAQGELCQLEQHAKDELASRIEQQAAQRFASEAGSLGGEVVDNLVLSQASVAITGAVTPILPELVALKAAVGVIKFALHPFA